MAGICQAIGMAAPVTKVTISTPDLVSIPEAAKELGVNFSTVYRWIRKGEVTPFSIGHQTYLPTVEVKKLKKQRGGNVNKA